MFEAIGRFFLPVLEFLFNTFGSLGVAIIVFTIFTRLLILPLTIKQLRSQKSIQRIQPKLRELQRKHGRDRVKLQEETLKLYRTEGVNPAGGCLPLLLTLPLLLGVWQAVLQFEQAYPDTAFPFLWIDSLTKVEALGLPGKDPFWILPILSIVLQYVVQLMATPRNPDPQQAQMYRIMMFMPLMFGWFAFTVPAATVLYMITGSLIGIVQQFFTTGFGSLPKYLTFLPERQGFLTPPPVTADDVIDVAATEVEDTTPRRDFWTVLGKLQEPVTVGVGADDVTEQAITETKQQISGKKRTPRG